MTQRKGAENRVKLAKQDGPTNERALFGETYNPNPSPTVGFDPVKAVSYLWVRQGDGKLIVPENLGHRDLLHKGWPKIGTVKKTDHFTEPRLFNLSDDPRETTNLADSQPDKQKELRELLDEWWPLAPQVDASR